METDTFMTHPGQVLRELLKQNQMTLQELSCRSGISVKHISEWIHFKKGLNVKMAVKLADVFDLPASFFMQLQCRYDMQREEIIVIQEMSESEKKLAESLPYTLLHQWGYAPKKHPSVEEKVLYFRKLIGVSNLAYVPSYLENILEDAKEWPPYALAVWLKIGQWEASRMEISRLDKVGLKKQLPTLHALMKLTLNEAIIPLSTQLASFGVALSIIAPLPQLDAKGFISYHRDHVVLAIAENFVYEDEFWLILFQMLGILLTEKKQRIRVIRDGRIPSKADRFAKKQWISAKDYTQLVENISLENILDTASRNGILIGQLIGLLIDDGYLEKDAFSDFRRKKAVGFY